MLLRGRPPAGFLALARRGLTGTTAVVVGVMKARISVTDAIFGFIEQGDSLHKRMNPPPADLLPHLSAFQLVLVLIPGTQLTGTRLFAKVVLLTMRTFGRLIECEILVTP